MGGVVVVGHDPFAQHAGKHSSHPFSLQLHTPVAVQTRVVGAEYPPELGSLGSWYPGG